jgi:hypothetical protein
MVVSARLIVKMIENIDIYDILIAYMLSEMSDKFFLYIDDRDFRSTMSSIDSKIKNILDVMNKFGIRIDGTIRYTDYYDTVWVYLHRLAQQKKVTVKSNSEYIHDNTYNILQNKNRVKIMLNNSYCNYSHSDNLLYDSGWFRGSFIELIIDDSEKTTYCTDDQIDGNKNITTNLIELLGLNRPTYVLQHVVDAITRIRKEKKNTINLNHKNNLLYLHDLSFDQIHIIGLSLMDMKKIILEPPDVSFTNIIYRCQNPNDPNDPDNHVIECFDDPIIIMLEQPKEITIDGMTVLIKDSICVDRSLMGQSDRKRIRLKYAGLLQVSLVDGVYRGEWLSGDKKKKLRQTDRWTIANNNIFNYDGSKKIVFCQNDILKINSSVLIKIKESYYILNHSTRDLVKIK